MDRDVTDTARAMKIGVVLPASMGSSADPDWVREFAQQTEALGFDEISVIEHSVVIADTSSTYPYSPTGRSPLPDDCVIPDPLELLAFMAGCTSRIGLSTGVLVVPNHQPVVLAKRLASLDRLSAGRLRICIGVGWMREEVEACGGTFADRGRFTDEAITAMRALWADTDPAGATFDGEFVSFKGAFSYPKPYRSSGVPLHIGGHSGPAARRAGRLGDGFQPLGLAGEELDAVLGEVRRAARYRTGAGRDRQPGRCAGAG
jgi:probable F420-dependent oxidoreductase